MIEDSKNESDVYALVDMRIKEFCAKAKEVAKQFPALTEEQIEEYVERKMDEFLDVVLEKLLAEEHGHKERSQLEKEAVKLRKYARTAMRQYM